MFNSEQTLKQVLSSGVYYYEKINTAKEHQLASIRKFDHSQETPTTTLGKLSLDAIKIFIFISDC